MVLQVDEPTSSPPTDDEFSGLFKVFSTERHRKTMTSMATTPISSTGVVPQYSYHSDAEDPTLIEDLAMLLWEGHLPAATPAQVLTASPALCKNFVEKLWTKCTENLAFTTVAPPPTGNISHGVFELATTRQAAFSLPLWEVEVVVNGNSTENAVLDQGSQIVAIRADVAQACSAHVNMEHRIQMEGANGIRSWTLGCAEDLCVSIGDLSFTIHAHVLESAPFRLLLG